MQEDSLSLKEILIGVDQILKRNKRLFLYGIILAIIFGVILFLRSNKYESSFSVETKVVHHETITQSITSFGESIRHKQFSKLSEDCGCSETILHDIKELRPESPAVVSALPDQGAWITVSMTILNPEDARQIADCVKSYINNNPIIAKELLDFRALQSDLLEKIEPEIKELNRQQELVSRILNHELPDDCNIVLNNSFSEMSALLHAKQQATAMLLSAGPIELVTYPTIPTVPMISPFKVAVIALLIAAFLITLLVILREIRLYIRS